MGRLAKGNAIAAAGHRARFSCDFMQNVTAKISAPYSSEPVHKLQQPPEHDDGPMLLLHTLQECPCCAHAARIGRTKALQPSQHWFDTLHDEEVDP